MCQWLTLFQIVFLLLSIHSARAHDIGISQATFLEKQDNNYELSVQTTPSKAYLFQTPIIPERCYFSTNPRSNIIDGVKKFTITCPDALTAKDQITLPWQRDGILLKITWLNGSNVQQLLRYKAGTIQLDLGVLKAGSGSFVDIIIRYVTLGIEHILGGLDHLLFVLGLLLLVSNGWLLVKTITAFTVAHSLSLALATLGIISVPVRPVEAVIALSIVLLAVEIHRAYRGRYGLTYRYPWAIAFGFGLIHGLGFASALSDIGLPQSEIPAALLFFNIGVELGQLMFVLAFLLLKRLFAEAIAKSSLLIRMIPVYFLGITACFWFLERVKYLI